LNGASNYVIWKTRILVVREEYDLEAYVKSVVVVLTDNDQKKKYKSRQGKAKRLILDGVQDHVVSHRARIQPERCRKPCLLCMKDLPNNGRCI